LTKPELRISDVIMPETVDFSLEGIATKDQVIRHLVHLLYEAGKVTSEDIFLQAVYEREAMGPTFMENFIAIPHGKSTAVISPGVAFGRSDEGIQYDTALGGGIAKLIFLLAIPEEMSAREYIGVLARLARLLVHEDFCSALYAATTCGDVVAAIQSHETTLESPNSTQ
jgi:fructose-specific phosphotransferase system IIA component